MEIDQPSISEKASAFSSRREALVFVVAGFAFAAGFPILLMLTLFYDGEHAALIQLLLAAVTIPAALGLKLLPRSAPPGASFREILRSSFISLGWPLRSSLIAIAIATTVALTALVIFWVLLFTN